MMLQTMSKIEQETLDVPVFEIFTQIWDLYRDLLVLQLTFSYYLLVMSLFTIMSFNQLLSCKVVWLCVVSMQSFQQVK